MSEQVEVPCTRCAAVVRIPKDRLGDGPRCPQCHTAFFGGHPLEVDASTFQRQLERSELPLVVDFWAFEAAAHKWEPRVRFLKVNTDEVPELASRFGIRGIPTLLVFNQGKEAARQSGAMNGQQLDQWLTRSVA